MKGLTLKDHLRNAIEHEGGFTYSPVSTTPKTGFMLGIKAIAHLPSNDETLDDEVLIEALNLTTKNPKLYLGGWKDPDGSVWYDISEWIENRSEAIERAQNNGEKAIFDLGSNTEILV